MGQQLLPGLKGDDQSQSSNQSQSAPATTATVAPGAPLLPGLKGGDNPVTVAGNTTTLTLPPQVGMTPFRAATTNPEDDYRANLALALHNKYGTPLPYGQQSVPVEPWALTKAALTDDPAGLAANVAQGASFGGAGYFYPGLKKRAESYAGMYPTEGRLANMVGGAAPTIAGGWLADVAAAPLAARPLLQALVRYLPSTGIGAAQGYVNSPDEGSTGAKLINTVLGALTGAGGQLMSDAGGNLVNRIETGRMPTMKPVVKPIAVGAGKTALTAGGGYLAHKLSELTGIPLDLETLTPLAIFSPQVRHAIFSGPEEMWTGAKNLLSNIYRPLSTPSGPARVAGRFVPGRFPPPRTAIPAAVAAPYLAGATTPSALAEYYARHDPGSNTPPPPKPF